MASRLSIEERRFIASRMDVWYSPIRVQRAFQEEFGKDPPQRRTISRVYHKWVKTGSVQNNIRGVSGRRRSVRTMDMIHQIELAVTRNPGQSTTRLARQFGISQTTVQKICARDLGFHPYHIQYVQKLRLVDQLNRVDACRTFVALTAIDPDFSKKIIFSDEAIFHINGQVNRHNSIFWGSERPPDTIQELTRDSPKVVVWCAVHPTGIVGPYFFAETYVNQHNYAAMFENFFMENLPLYYRKEGYFQQDGAPCHFAHRVRNLLNASFPQRWIGRGGPIAWPAYSPDLSALDFWLWGMLKNRVYGTPIANLEELKTRITTIICGIPASMCSRAINAAFERFDLCIEVGGRQVEPYLA